MSAPNSTSSFDPNKATPSYNPNQPITPPKGVAPKPSKVDEKTTTVSGQTLANTTPVVLRVRKGSTRSPLPDFSNMTTGLSNSTPPQTPSRAYEFAKESARKAKASAQKVKRSTNETLGLVAAEAPAVLTPSKMTHQKIISRTVLGDVFFEAPSILIPTPTHEKEKTNDFKEGESEVSRRLEFGPEETSEKSEASISEATKSASLLTTQKEKSTTTEKNEAPTKVKEEVYKGKAKDLHESVLNIKSCHTGLIDTLDEEDIECEARIEFYVSEILKAARKYESTKFTQRSRKTQWGSTGIQSQEFAEFRASSKEKKTDLDITIRKFLLGLLLKFNKPKHWKKFPTTSSAPLLIKWVPLDKQKQDKSENLQEYRKAIGNFILLLQKVRQNVETGTYLKRDENVEDKAAFYITEAKNLGVPLELYKILRLLNSKLESAQPEDESKKKAFFSLYLDKTIKLLNYYAHSADHLRKNEFRDIKSLAQLDFSKVAEMKSKTISQKPSSRALQAESSARQRRKTVVYKNPNIIKTLSEFLKLLESFSKKELKDTINSRPNDIDPIIKSIIEMASAMLNEHSNFEETEVISYLDTSDVEDICYSKFKNSEEHDAILNFMKTIMARFKSSFSFPTFAKPNVANSIPLNLLGLTDFTAHEYVTVYNYKTSFSHLMRLMNEVVENIKYKNTGPTFHKSEKNQRAFAKAKNVPFPVAQFFHKMLHLIIQYAEMTDPRLVEMEKTQRSKNLNDAYNIRFNQLITSLKDGGNLSEFDDKLALLASKDSVLAKLKGCTPHGFERPGQLGIRSVQIAMAADLYSEDELEATGLDITLPTLPSKCNEWDSVFGGGACLKITLKDTKSTKTYTSKVEKEENRALELYKIVDLFLEGINAESLVREKINKLLKMFLELKQIDVSEILKTAEVGDEENEDVSILKGLIKTLNESKNVDAVRRFECFGSVLQVILKADENHPWSMSLIKLLITLACVNQQSALTHYKQIGGIIANKLRLGDPRADDSFVKSYRPNQKDPQHSFDSMPRLVYEFNFVDGNFSFSARSINNFNTVDPLIEKPMFGVAPLMFEENYILKIPGDFFANIEQWESDYFSRVIRTTEDTNKLIPYNKFNDWVQLVLAHLEIECRTERVLK